jgi:hypothetical protein
LRQEDKEVDGFELERAEERKRESDLIAEDEEELHDLEGRREVERDRSRTDVIAGAMHRILAREHLVINDLDLDRRELRALEALKTAVDGRDQELSAFVYAEDRSTLLEQALAVLQPDLVNLERLGGESFDELVSDVAELRAELDMLQDAEAELGPREPASDKGEAGDSDDKPDSSDDDASLTGPERKQAPKPPSSLAGSERKDEQKPPSSLTGPERKDEPKPASSLTGPERKEAPRPPTSLGDPKEIAEAAKPWWRRT